jgi:site-specific DNA-methyltransferase (adenine-specific)
MQLLLGDCLNQLAVMPDACVDAVVTDPPYGLAFMGKRWDYDVPSIEIWAQCLRVLKPGGHLLAFAGTRTQHRMAVRIEDAGFEIRDMIAWVYGSGFPKSHNLKDDWEGWGTALKPALEPITMARKPLGEKTVAANLIQHGTGALNVDGCRVVTGESLGRWPANLLHDGSDEVVGLFPQSAGQQGALNGTEPSSKTSNAYGEFAARAPMLPRGDTGSAARFFYQTKCSKKDRGEGNGHPTVKPTGLMRYLCRLVTPPGGIVLDPFMGSGSTGKAAVLEGFGFIGIEREPEYLEIARRRIAAASPDRVQLSLLAAAF